MRRSARSDRGATALSVALPDPDGDRLELLRRQQALEEGYRTALAAAIRAHGDDPAAVNADPGEGLAAIAAAVAVLTGGALSNEERARFSRNPYGRLVETLAAGCAPAVRQQILRQLRPPLTTTFSYAVPSDQALARIAALGTGEILEIGAGGGYWARCLTAFGAVVHAFDRLAPAAQRRKAGSLAPHFPIFLGGPAEALGAYPRCPTLLLCWPPGISNREEAAAGALPRFSPMGEEALAAFKGEHLVFVGSHTNSFGSPAFFARLEREWHLVEELPLANLGSWRDAVFIHRTRRPSGLAGRSSLR